MRWGKVNFGVFGERMSGVGAGWGWVGVRLLNDGSECRAARNKPQAATVMRSPEPGTSRRRRAIACACHAKGVPLRVAHRWCDGQVMARLSRVLENWYFAETPRVFAAPDRPVTPEACRFMGGAPLMRRAGAFHAPEACQPSKPSIAPLERLQDGFRPAVGRWGFGTYQSRKSRSDSISTTSSGWSWVALSLRRHLVSSSCWVSTSFLVTTLNLAVVFMPIN